MNERDNNIDVFKGVGIFLIVTGHVPGVPEDIFTYIYSFHVPIFFFCSGYLMYLSRDKKMTIKYFKIMFKKIMIPFYLAYVFSYVVTLFFETDKRSFLFFIEFLKGGLLGSHWMDVNNFPLWFLPLFFLSTLIFRYISSFPIYIVGLIGILSFLVAPYAYLWLENPEEKIMWSINVLFPAFFLMSLGFLVNHFDGFRFFGHWLSPYIALLCGALGLYLAFWSPSEILYIENYWYLIGAVLTIVFFIWITKDNSNQVLLYLGKNSLLILLVHKIINYILLELKVDQILHVLISDGTIYAITFSMIITFLSVLPKLVKI